MELLIAFIGGLVVGSFLNVCIVRIPEERSVATPRSHCPQCSQPIRWHDNIPLVSYALLRGRCRDCDEPISLRYPLVELTTGLIFVLLAMRGFEARELFVNLALASALVAITFIDLDHFIIPDVISIPSILIAPGLALLVGHVSLADSLLGILMGGGLLWGFALGYELLRKQEGMGFGDVKLLAMIGGFQGWQGALFSVLLGAVSGSIVGALLLAARRGRLDTAVPFGPFLALGSLTYALRGPELIAWYFGHAWY